ncbi:MAG: response regulator transcription factor [Saprospiraceae bacterium]|nr:response regulator transcription factor [Saprospiraceae bacterium]
MKNQELETNTLRCMIVDDEHFAIQLLEKFVADTAGLEVAATSRSPVRAIELLQSEPVDLLFLDIQMPIMSGINLLRSISRVPVTIFTTAYPQHAVEAFDLDAADYLLKPFSFERFTHAVEKARALIRTRQEAGPDIAQGTLIVKADRAWVKVPFSEIRYIEGWREYVKIYAGKDKIVTLESLNNLEDTLPESHFIRVHKSFIVAKNQVQKMDGEQLTLLDGSKVPVARARKKEVTAALFAEI